MAENDRLITFLLGFLDFLCFSCFLRVVFSGGDAHGDVLVSFCYELFSITASGLSILFIGSFFRSIR